MTEKKSSAVARRCVKMINSYWEAKGVNANARIVPNRIMKLGKVVEIRHEIQSDLGPMRYAPTAT